MKTAHVCQAQNFFFPLAGTPEGVGRPSPRARGPGADVVAPEARMTKAWCSRLGCPQRGAVDRVPKSWRRRGRVPTIWRANRGTTSWGCSGPGAEDGRVPKAWRRTVGCLRQSCRLPPKKIGAQVVAPDGQVSRSWRRTVGCPVLPTSWRANRGTTNWGARVVARQGRVPTAWRWRVGCPSRGAGEEIKWQSRGTGRSLNHGVAPKGRVSKSWRKRVG